MSHLRKISSPADLKLLSVPQLDELAAEMRDELIATVTKTGGHLGANLGTVELTIALHYVFDSPRDSIVWDVGHQAYNHKLLTGRLDRFDTIRQEGGISGFLSRDESVHDVFGAGHASTAISAALGMAIGAQYKPVSQRGRAVAIIGDGALTGGMAFEALNHAGSLSVPFIVVLNDNEMSIAPNVGALSKYLDRVRSDSGYRRAKQEIATMVEGLPKGDFLLELGKRWKDSIKEFVYHSMIWEELGFTYLGPIDGHDIPAMLEAMRQAKRIDGPVFLHVVTQKGKGYAAAEADRERGHSVSAKSTPAAPDAPKPAPRYQDVFAQALIELANEHPEIVGITAAMPSGTSLGTFQQSHPEKFFDVGIAEQHGVTFAAGLATQGLRPVCAIYSTFLQRAYDQIVHDVCIQRLPVVFAMDRAGFAGDDGRTHHGVFDLSYLRCLPNMTIAAPKDETELRDLLKTAVEHNDGPFAIRYPRGSGVGADTNRPMRALPVGVGETLRDGGDVALIAVGSMVPSAMKAAELLHHDRIEATVINARFIKPLDSERILGAAHRCGAIVTIEENAVRGGFGSAVLELLAEHGLRIPVRTLGVPDHFFEQASQTRLRELAGLSPIAIAEAAREVRTVPGDDRREAAEASVLQHA